MDKKDVYKFRAEEFERSFFSLRNLEWKIIFQLYIGYAAIAAAFVGITNKYEVNSRISTISTLVVIVLAGIETYLSLRIQERLHLARDKQNKYIDKLHDETGAVKITSEIITKNKRWWGFIPQHIISYIWALGLIIYFWYAR